MLPNEAQQQKAQHAQQCTEVRDMRQQLTELKSMQMAIANLLVKDQQVAMP